MIAVQSQASVSPRSTAIYSSADAPSPLRSNQRSPLMPVSNPPSHDPSQAEDVPQSVEEQSKIKPKSRSNTPSSLNLTNGNGRRSLSGSPSSLKKASPRPEETRDLSLQTREEDLRRDDLEDDEPEPQSVIHAPVGFDGFTVESPAPSTTSSTQISDVTITVPRAESRKSGASPISPPPITTSVAPTGHYELNTPRAQTLQEIENFKRTPHQANLDDIPESSDTEQSQDGLYDDSEQRSVWTKTRSNVPDNDVEIRALRTALSECWTLCNTLANLSYNHRERLFNFGGKDDMQEQAWKTCWKLCQNLYETRDDDHSTQVRPTLDMCRDFCQALFEVRLKENEIADSVLRVSFELNNHLYNTHDRNLPEAFRERTLDFYITLCHRLMKQRTRLTEETDSLLRACWSLAEMLFSLRQGKREGKAPDEELLGSAVQACWELCDLFREGWTQVRPDRGTPRPSQTTFTQAFYQAKRAEYPSEDTDTDTDSLLGLQNPETPTTIFDDTATTVSPDQAPIPNIMVLGFDNPPHHPRWSSNSSTLSGYSRTSSQTASSTHTVKSPGEDQNLTALKLLLVRAAMNSGFQRGGSESLPTFAKTLSSDAFGSLPWQMSLLVNYKKLITADPAFRSVPPPTRASAIDVARAVQAMVQYNSQYEWLLDLYRLVFGFYTDDAVNATGMVIQS
ncbi:Nitrogen permease regulator 2 protein [Trichophyton interdigitale]|nr:Nitrogen permease regulator 2 protein [Trichophyton interdigitale]KAG5217877.1 Nitrogen permease regulator 2 protein [Trichophyton interdigitale]KAG8207251.1 Nitrogen permease regulator 2 protein [Trichophyton interdigitale]